VIPWTIFYHPQATTDIRRIPRDVAATVTDAIKELARHPAPFEAVAIGDAMPNAYLLDVTGHVVAYEVLEAKRTIRVLWIG
jgi:mRNA-degrading endonuclease RelE of RelBE toxin-antitoxin system